MFFVMLVDTKERNYAKKMNVQQELNVDRP